MKAGAIIPQKIVENLRKTVYMLLVVSKYKNILKFNLKCIVVYLYV